MKRGRALRHRYGHALQKGASHVQSLLFSTSRFTLPAARAWASKHHWKSDDVDIKPDFIHFRQEDPAHFKVLRTIFLGGSGVEARVGWAS
jgi:hypothetical protein